MDLSKVLAEIEEALAKATPGPWTDTKPKRIESGPAEGFRDGMAIVSTGPGNTLYAKCDRGSFPAADLRCIASLRNRAPLLLAALRVAMANREMDSCVFVASSLRDAEWMGRWSRAHDEQNDARAAFEAELERE